MVGTQIVYTIDIFNDVAATKTARDVLLRDFYPPGMSPVMVPVNCSTTTFGGQEIVLCDMGDFAPGQLKSVQLTFMATTNLCGSGPVTNIALAFSTLDSDEDETDNRSMFTNAIVSPYDLVIAKTAAPNPLVTGQIQSNRIHVLNKGPCPAVDTVLVDELPTNTPFIAVNGSTNCVYTNGIVTCGLGTIDPGEERFVEILIVPTNAPEILTNAAAVSAKMDATHVELTPADNSALFTSQVIDVSVDLEVFKSADTGSLDAGGDLTYTLVVTNHGPDVAMDVTLTDNLPFGVVFSSATGSVGLCVAATNTITCDLGDMNSGDSVIVTVVVMAAVSGEFTNIAEVATVPVDTNLLNNADTVGTTVNTPADTDGAGMPDWFELMHFTNAVNGDAEGDNDGDGVKNGDEYDANTDPNDENSFPRIDGIAINSPVVIEFETRPARAYDVQYSEGLTSPQIWQDLTGGIAGDGAIKSATDTNDAESRNYRLDIRVP